MSISTPPPVVVQKKRGLGCLGCGCALLVVFFLLVAGLLVGAVYFSYTKLVDLTSTAPSEVPAFSGTDDLYRSTQQKLGDFNHDVKNHQAATVRLTADEINTMIARNPEYAKANMHLFVSLADDTGRLQGSVPTASIPMLHGTMAGRYVNFDASFRVSFDPATKSILLDFTALRLGPDTLIGEDASSEDTTGYSKGFARGFAQSFAPAFNKSSNDAIRNNPDGASFLDQAKSVDIENGQLVIQTH